MARLRAKKIAAVLAGLGGMAGLGGVTWAPVSFAQAMPADCSVGAIGDGPLMLRRTGMPDQLLPSVRVVRGNSLSFSSDDGDGVYPYHMMQLDMTDRARDDIFDPVVEVDTNFLLAEGDRLDGRTFRKPAAESDTPEDEAQERIEGQVVFQTWGVKIPVPGADYGNYAVDVNHVFYKASAQVQFDKRTGNQLAGKIHLCVPGGQVDPFDNPPNEAIEVVGSFVAIVE